MSIKLSEIKDPSLRATIERQMASETRPARRVVLAKALCDCESLSGHAHRTDCPLIAEQAKVRRLRQSHAPLMNKLEQAAFDWLASSGDCGTLRAQALRFRLGNGIWYRPDISDTLHLGQQRIRLTLFEVKGPHAFRGGFENLKVAAGLYPEFRWVLLWREGGEWRSQEVLP